MLLSRFMRIVALFWLMQGLMHWRIVLMAKQSIFDTMPQNAAFAVVFFAVLDLVGLDTRLSILRYLHQTLGEKFRPAPLLEKYVAEGRLGRKVGRGVFEYPEILKQRDEEDRKRGANVNS